MPSASRASITGTAISDFTPTARLISRFRPNRYYIRKMQLYGIFTKDLPPHASIDPYATDQVYWGSLQFVP
ncbi:MAG: hypothetical protein HUU20_14360 [Pirellulales bacterium]|nr:hypothetical protein [Pirellulales bacterium]